MDAQGEIRLDGKGAYDDETNVWSSDYHGKLPKSGEVHLAGEVVTRSGERRECSLLFFDAAGRLRAEIAAFHPPSPAAEISRHTSQPPSNGPAVPPTVSPKPEENLSLSDNRANIPKPANQYDPMSIVVTIVNGDNAHVADERIAELKAEIDLFTQIKEEQVNLEQSVSEDAKSSLENAVSAIDVRLAALRNAYSAAEKPFQAYLTSLKPNDRDLYVTAKRASEIYPKIPYYIPGTSETGEFWVEPSVSDRGELRFAVKFIDKAASIDKVREAVNMSLSELIAVQQALLKLHDWSKIAHDQSIRRNYEKRIICFPTSECPPDGETIEDKLRPKCASMYMRMARPQVVSNETKVDLWKGITSRSIAPCCYKHISVT
jgi:hypothetical protein